MNKIVQSLKTLDQRADRWFLGTRFGKNRMVQTIERRPNKGSRVMILIIVGVLAAIVVWKL